MAGRDAGSSGGKRGAEVFPDSAGDGKDDRMPVNLLIKKRASVFCGLALLALSGASAAVAVGGSPRIPPAYTSAEQIHLPANGQTLVIDGGRVGRVRVQAWDQKAILVETSISVWGETLEDARERSSRIAVETNPSIRATTSMVRGWRADFTVYAPRSYPISIVSESGDIEISGLDGDVEIESHNGDLVCRGVEGKVNAATRNGSIYFQTLLPNGEGEDVMLASRNGGIYLDLPIETSAQLIAETRRGNIRTDSEDAVSTLRGEGLLAIGEGRRRFRCSTRSGDIVITRR